MFSKSIKYLIVFALCFAVGAIVIDVVTELVSRKLEHRALYDEKRFQSLMQYFMSLKKDN